MDYKLTPEAWHFPVPVCMQGPGVAQQGLAPIVQPKSLCIIYFVNYKDSRN